MKGITSKFFLIKLNQMRKIRFYIFTYTRRTQNTLKFNSRELFNNDEQK